MQYRNRKFVFNSTLSLLQQIVAVICGLILPNMILSTYGSAINGTISSISQFLSFITLLQGGVGTVARLAFYKPLAENNKNMISIVYKTVNKYFRKFAIIFAFYLVGLAFIYPFLVKTGYAYWNVLSLVIIVGIASVFEYFFGQASQLLLYTDQKGYIYSLIQIVCIILSTIIGICLINLNCSIHVVKLGSAIIFAIRPLVLYFIVRKKYCIDDSVKSDKSLLVQRNAALVRHIAYYVYTSTDIMVLTIFTDVLKVSVYTVHRYVASSLSNLVSSVLGNTEVVFGDMIARKETEIMKKEVPIYDLFSKIISSSCFFTCIILISQFVSIYTHNVSDINYHRPVFAILLVTSEMIYCMGLTYQNIYIAAGHIKQTQCIAVTEAIINLGLSLLLVKKLGIVGVAIGTVLGMTFKTLANISYMKKNVFDMSITFIIKSYVVNIGVGIIMTILFSTIMYHGVNNYLEFFIYAIVVFISVTVGIVFTNMIVFKKETKGLLNVIMRKLKNK